MKLQVFSIILTTVCIFSTMSCDSTRQGAMTGALIGGVSGALIDSSNPWRGGLIGGVVGTIAGATISEISKKGAREAAENGHSVEYKSEDGRIYRADPMGSSKNGRCRKIRERIWKDGKLVQEQVRQICRVNGRWN